MRTNLLLAAVPLLVWGACAQPEEASAADSRTSTASQTQTVQIAISGMT